MWNITTVLQITSFYYQAVETQIHILLAHPTVADFSSWGHKASGGSEVKASAWNSGDLGSIPGSGRSPGEGNGNTLQYSCLENPMEGGAW